MVSSAKKGCGHEPPLSKEISFLQQSLTFKGRPYVHCRWPTQSKLNGSFGIFFLFVCLFVVLVSQYLDWTFFLNKKPYRSFVYNYGF